MGFFEEVGDVIFGEKEKSPEPERLGPEWQQDLQKTLATTAEPKALEAIDIAGEPYEGDLVAPLTDIQEGTLDQLSKYLESPELTETEGYEASEEELMSTLGGEYDPFKGEYYKSLRRGLRDELKSQTEKMERSLPTSSFYGSERVEQEGELREDYLNKLTQTLGKLGERERERRLKASGMLADLTRTGERAEARKLAEVQELAGLERDQKQQALSAAYKEYQRQLKSYGLPANIAQQMATKDFQYYQPSYQRGVGLYDIAKAGADVAGTFYRGPKGGNVSPGTSTGRKAMKKSGGYSGETSIGSYRGHRYY